MTPTTRDQIDMFLRCKKEPLRAPCTLGFNVNGKEQDFLVFFIGKKDCRVIAEGAAAQCKFAEGVDKLVVKYLNGQS